MGESDIKILIGADIEPSIDQVLKDLRTISTRINQVSNGAIKFIPEVDIQKATDAISKIQKLAKDNNIDLNLVPDWNDLLQNYNKVISTIESNSSSLLIIKSKSLDI